jgi:hypothetical protein
VKPRHALTGLALPILGLLLFTSTGRDDAHITYWAAYSLAHFGKILNYSGLPVEQSSTLLQTLLLAGLHSLSGLDLVILGKLLSIIFGAACAITLARLADRVAPALVLSSLPSFVYWAFSGMEATLTAFTLLNATLATASWLEKRRGRQFWLAGLWVALLVLVRPELPIVWLAGLGLAAGWQTLEQLLLNERPLDGLWKGYLPIALLSLGLFAGLMLLRSAVFGMPFPQPVSVKTNGLDLDDLHRGLQYLAQNARPENLLFTALAALGGAALLFGPRSSTSRDLPRLAAALSLMQLAFITVTGGDWMEGGRFLVPILPLLAFFTTAGLTALTKNERLEKVGWAALLTLNLAALLAFAAQQSTGTPLWSTLSLESRYQPQAYTWFERRNRINLRDIPVIETLDRLVAEIYQQKGAPVVLLSGQMGMVPYRVAENHFGQIIVLDRRGLSSRELVTCPAADALPRTSTGVQLLYVDFFKHLAEFQACGVPWPDLIYDLGNPESVHAPETEYTLAYWQAGELSAGGILPGMTVITNEYIYIRRGYLSAVTRTSSQPIDFNHLIKTR